LAGTDPKPQICEVVAGTMVLNCGFRLASWVPKRRAWRRCSGYAPSKEGLRMERQFAVESAADMIGCSRLIREDELGGVQIARNIYNHHRD
jgi:hypothetical protein